MRIVASTALLSLSSAAPVAAQTLQTSDAVKATDQQAEIIVHGRRSEQYRIPPELRTLPAERSERWRKDANRDLFCQRVGPRGCGPPVMRLITITSDGKVRIGQKDDEK